MSNMSKDVEASVSTKNADLNPYETNEIIHLDRSCRKVEEIPGPGLVIPMSTWIGDMASTFRQTEVEVSKPP